MEQIKVLRGAVASVEGGRKKRRIRTTQKDRLPPGLEKHLVRNGTLPPGPQKRFYPAPVELERRLPPPPPDCAHVLIGGHIVLLNRKTNLIVDVFAF